jgi:hypothetical protein
MLQNEHINFLSYLSIAVCCIEFRHSKITQDYVALSFYLAVLQILKFKNWSDLE